MSIVSREDPEIFKMGEGALYGGHHCFRWSKMAKITIETISFW